MPRSRVTNAANARQVRAAGQAEAREERERQAELRELLSMPAFRRYIWWVLEHTPIALSLGGPGSAELLNYREGQRALGVLISEDMINTDADAYMLMQAEAFKRKRERDDATGTDEPAEPDSESGTGSEPDA